MTKLPNLNVINWPTENYYPLFYPYTFFIQIPNLAMLAHSQYRSLFHWNAKHFEIHSSTESSIYRVKEYNKKNPYKIIIKINVWLDTNSLLHYWLQRQISKMYKTIIEFYLNLNSKISMKNIGYDT